MKLTEKNQKFLLKLYKTEFKDQIFQISKSLARKFPTQSRSSFEADIKLWAFVIISKNWDENSMSLVEYTAIAIEKAASYITKLRKKGAFDVQDLTNNIWDTK